MLSTWKLSDVINCLNSTHSMLVFLVGNNCRTENSLLTAILICSQVKQHSGRGLHYCHCLWPMIHSIYCSQHIWAELLVKKHYPTTTDFQTTRPKQRKNRKYCDPTGLKEPNYSLCIVRTPYSIYFLCLDLMASLDEAWRNNGNRINGKRAATLK